MITIEDAFATPAESSMELSCLRYRLCLPEVAELVDFYSSHSQQRAEAGLVEVLHNLMWKRDLGVEAKKNPHVSRDNVHVTWMKLQSNHDW